MAEVTFRNILESESEFKTINEEYLVPAAYAYARLFVGVNDELYDAIMRNKIVIYKNYECIHPDNWGTTTVTDSDKIIISSEIGKSAFAAVLQIVIGVVLIVASIYQPALWGITAEWWTANALTIGLMGGALALSGISSLLFRPDLPNPDIRMGGGQSQTYNWSGIKTNMGEGTPIPVVYGTHKVGGNVISMFTERSGTSDYLYMLLALSEGPIDGICLQKNYASTCSTSDPTSAAYRAPAIEIDDQPLSAYTGVQWWYRKGTNATAATYDQYNPSYQDKIPGFDGARAQFDDGREISAAGITYTTTKEVDKAVIHVRCPALYNNSSGAVNEYSVTYRVQYRVEGDSTWIDAYQQAWEASTLSAVTAAGVSYAKPRVMANPYYLSGVTQFGIDKPPEYEITILNIRPDTTWAFNPFLDLGGRYVYPSELSKDYYIDYMYKNLETGEIQYNVVAIYLTRVLAPGYEWWWDGYGWLEPTGQYIGDWAVGPTSYSAAIVYAGPYGVILDRSISIGSVITIDSISGFASNVDMTITGKTKSGLWSSVLLDFNSLEASRGRAVYEIKVFRPYSEKSSSMLVEDNIFLQSVIEVVEGKFIYPNTALLGVKILATGQLSGSPPNITTVLRGRTVSVPDMQDASPSGSDVTFDLCDWDTTSNKWELISTGAEVFWNDTSSWRTEYTNNSMLCVRDLISNKRYGLGEYISITDLYAAGIETVIKYCHVKYEPSESDYLKWWDGNNNDDFIKNISTDIATSSQVFLYKDSRTIDFTDVFFWALLLKLDAPLMMGQKYVLSITLNSLTNNVDLGPYALINQTIGAFYICEALFNKTNGTHTFTFVVNQTGITGLRINISTASSNNLTSGTIADISLNQDGTDRTHYHTYDGVLDSPQSALVALLEMCDSFRTWPVWYDGKFNFIIDKDDTPIQTLSVGNTISFDQTFVPVSEIPYRLIGQFADADNSWNLKSLIAKATDTTLTKINEKTIGLKGITNRRKAERELIFKLNKATNCSHAVRVKAGLDSVHFTGGDVFYLQDNLPQWGTGGRILGYTATDLIVNEPVVIADNTATNIVRYQTSTNSYVTATLNTASYTNGTSHQYLKVVAFPGGVSPKSDAVFAFGKSGSFSKKFRAVSVTRSQENEVEIQAIEHLSSLYASEPAITTVLDTTPPVDNPLKKPSPPVNIVVSSASITDGIGFYIKADPPPNEPHVKDILVYMREETESVDSFEQIAILSPSQRSTIYINYMLKLDTTYFFRFMSRTAFKTSDPVEVSAELLKSSYKLPPPTGIHIKGKDRNDYIFDGKDVTIEWNSVFAPGLLNGYYVEVFHTNMAQPQRLRESFVSNEVFTYSFEMMMEDTGGDIYGTVDNKFIFAIRTVNIHGIMSSMAHPFECYNGIPATLGLITGISTVGGAKFVWSRSLEADHKGYNYGIKVATSTWSVFADTSAESYTKVLTSNEITIYGKRPVVYARVRDWDWYGQVSATNLVASAAANSISDNLFNLAIILDSGITGDRDVLVDNVNATPGGYVVIT